MMVQHKRLHIPKVVLQRTFDDELQVPTLDDNLGDINM